MILYLLRHGEAQARAHSDSERPLTVKGQQDVVSVAWQFAARKLKLDCCWVSSYLRASQTADIFLNQLEQSVKSESTDSLIPEVRANIVIRKLAETTSQHVLLVSHNPLLSELNAVLTQGDITDMHILSTSELVCITMDFVGMGLGSTSFRLLPTTAPFPY